MTYKFIQDAGHGWLQVPKEAVKGLGILPLVSNYSHEDATHFYLEEDMDATIFEKAFKMSFGVSPDFKSIDHGDHSTVRSLPRVSGQWNRDAAYSFLRGNL